MTDSQDFWPSSGFSYLHRNERGWLIPTDGYLRLYLARPELALVDESCAAEIALQGLLQDEPRAVVADFQMAAIEDPDVAANYRYFLSFRDGLLAAGTLEAWYLATIRDRKSVV